MAWFLTDMSSSLGVTPPTIVGSAKATTPADQDTGSSGTVVIIPVPATTQAGDLLLAVTWTNGTGPTALPSGWVSVLNDAADTFIISSKTASGSEPADYTWTVNTSGASRTGCMISIRGANSTLGDKALPVDSSLNVPSLTNNIEDSVLIAFNVAGLFNTATLYVVNSPLVEQTQHESTGSVSYSIPAASIIAVEEGLSEGTISGRSFTHANASNPFGAGIIVEGV